MKKTSGASYTAGELLFAIAIVSLGALALASSIVEVQNSELASKTTFAVVSLDRALAGELVRAANYTDETTKVALRSGSVPPSLQFNVATPAGSSVVVRPNETIYLDRAFRKCTTYPLSECGYKIRLGLEAHPPAFSYEVSSAFNEAALSLSRTGRNEWVIPRSFYRDSRRVACDTRREVGLTGLVSSDRYECIGRPQKSCPRGTLAKGLVVDASSGALELDCGAPSRVARCPAFYSLASVDTRSLDVTETKDIRCVRTTASVAVPAVQPEPALRMVGRACPTGYRSESTCALVNVRSKPGRCGVGVARPVPGKLRFSENKPVGSVDCGVELQAQTCGAIWMAFAELKIKCVLDQPEFANAL
jgi:hypothetical protein